MGEGGEEGEEGGEEEEEEGKAGSSERRGRSRAVSDHQLQRTGRRSRSPSRERTLPVGETQRQGRSQSPMRMGTLLAGRVRPRDAVRSHSPSVVTVAPPAASASPMRAHRHHTPAGKSGEDRSLPRHNRTTPHSQAASPSGRLRRSRSVSPQPCATVSPLSMSVPVSRERSISQGSVSAHLPEIRAPFDDYLVNAFEILHKLHRTPIPSPGGDVQLWCALSKRYTSHELTRTCSRVHGHTGTHAHRPTNIQTPTRTYTCIFTGTRTRTRTQTQTLTNAFSLSLSSSSSSSSPLYQPRWCGWKCCSRSF
jgi:hypothetical protein